MWEESRDDRVERWRSIAGAPRYEVSSWGRVRRGDLEVATWPNHKGYVMVSLELPTRERPVLRYVHRLVAAAFRGVDTRRRLVNHKDGDKGNNRLTNLVWSTPSSNVLHGRRLRLERHGQQSLFG